VITQTSPVYSRFAEVYDLAYHFIDYERAGEWVRDVIHTRRPSSGSLLEVACGTGRYLEILGRDYDVAGLDRSPQMLSKARERLPTVPLFQADMTEFNIGQKYDVVCCLFRSIGYVLTTARLRDAVMAMGQHLKDRGLVLIEPFFTPETYWVDRVTLNECRRTDFALAWMYVSERIETVARLRIHCLVGTPVGVEHFVETHEFGLFTRVDFEEAFEAAGLQLEFEPGGPGGTGVYVGWKA